MAFHRKVDALLSERPDIAIVGECASPEVLGAKADLRRLGEMVWVGDNPQKGLAVFARNGYVAELDDAYDPGLHHLAPIRITGAHRFNLLAVWAKNLSGGNYRKDQPGPLRLGLDRYRDFLTETDLVVGGDLNNNRIWDRPGWPINHMTAVDLLGDLGLASAYHHLRGEAHGKERTPTIYWRDRTLGGPRYHIDYVFVPEPWLDSATLRVGSFRKWVGTGLSDHVPLLLDVTPGALNPCR